MLLSFKQFKKEGFITICPKCQNEYKLDLIISFNCQCDRNKNYFHINELYNELKYKSVSRIVGVLLIDRRMTKSVKRKNYINFYLSKSKRLLQKTILNYFPTYYNIFSFKNKKYIEEDTAPFFSEEYINEISIKVNELKNDSIPLKILKEIKAFILDINIFNILLKKGYIYINEINNVINSILKKDIIEIKWIKQIKNNIRKIKRNEKLINMAKNNGTLKLHSLNINCIYPIIEKNIIIIAYQIDEKEIEFRFYDIYDIQDNNYIYLQKIKLNFEMNNIIEKGIKIYKIDFQLLLLLFTYNEGGANYYNIFLVEIKYDKNHKPININLLDEDKYKDIKNIIKKVKDFSIINNDNIIFTTRNSDKVYIFNKNKENQFSYKIIEIDRYTSIDDKSELDEKWGSSNKILADEINNQAIIYYSNRLIYKNDDIYLYAFFNFYDLTTYEFKKVIYLTEKEKDCLIVNDFERYNSLNILNEDYYCFFGRKIYLISAKHMEITTVYEKNYNYWDLYVLKNSNRIFLLDNIYLTIYTFQDKELRLIKKKFIIKENIVEIQEINNKGDYIIVTNSSKIYYFKANINNNKKIKDNYSILEDVTIIKKENNDDDNDDDEYYFENYEKIEDDFELNPNNSLFNYEKEDFHFIKKKYKNNNKRKYVNIRNLELIKKLFKYKKYKNKKNLNKYEKEDYEDNFINY